MTELYPVLIATKGRAGSSNTIESLLEGGASPILFVEPQDWDSYNDAYPLSGRVLIKKNNMGLRHARQTILEYARAQGISWYWMPDDDMTTFQVRNRRCHKHPMVETMLAAQKIFQGRGVAMGGLEWTQFAWAAKKPYVFCSYMDGFVCINTDRTRLVNYRPGLELKADRDFAMQVIASGHIVMRTTRYAFGTPTIRTNAGGSHYLYERFEQEKNESLLMTELWPGICTPITKKGGHKDVKIKWKALRQ